MNLAGLPLALIFYVDLSASRVCVNPMKILSVSADEISVFRPKFETQCIACNHILVSASDALHRSAGSGR